MIINRSRKRFDLTKYMLKKIIKSDKQVKGLANEDGKNSVQLFVVVEILRFTFTETFFHSKLFPRPNESRI